MHVLDSLLIDSLRDFVGNYLPQFRQQNPQFDIVAEERAGHPWLEATYRASRLSIHPSMQRHREHVHFREELGEEGGGEKS